MDILRDKRLPFVNISLIEVASLDRYWNNKNQIPINPVLGVHIQSETIKVCNVKRTSAEDPINILAE